MKRISFVVGAMLLSVAAQAALVPVSWINPSMNTDNTPLTDLSYVVVEWGTCNGSAFGVMQGSLLYATSTSGQAVSVVAEVTEHAARACFRANAFNAKGVGGPYSNVAVKDFLPTPGKPVTLDQPIILQLN